MLIRIELKLCIFLSNTVYFGRLFYSFYYEVLTPLLNLYHGYDVLSKLSLSIFSSIQIRKSYKGWLYSKNKKYLSTLKTWNHINGIIMSLACVYSRARVGLESPLVTVEVHLAIIPL